MNKITTRMFSMGVLMLMVASLLPGVMGQFHTVTHYVIALATTDSCGQTVTASGSVTGNENTDEVSYTLSVGVPPSVTNSFASVQYSGTNANTGEIKTDATSQTQSSSITTTTFNFFQNILYNLGLTAADAVSGTLQVFGQTNNGISNCQFNFNIPFSFNVASGGGDTDGDGLSDSDELSVYFTDPNDPDSDDDGLLDGAEVTTYFTNPLNPDTDGGGVNDGTEVLTNGTDPLNPNDDFVVVIDLSINLDATPSSATTNQEITVDGTVTNPTSTSATNTQVIIQVANGFMVTFVDPECTQTSPTQFECNSLTIPANGQKTVTVKGDFTTAATYTFSASVFLFGDPNNGNNHDSDTVTVTRPTGGTVAPRLNARPAWFVLNQGGGSAFPDDRSYRLTLKQQFTQANPGSYSAAAAVYRNKVLFTGTEVSCTMVSATAFSCPKPTPNHYQPQPGDKVAGTVSVNGNPVMVDGEVLTTNSDAVVASVGGQLQGPAAVYPSIGQATDYGSTASTWLLIAGILAIVALVVLAAVGRKN